jgi:hypothetical protein
MRSGASAIRALTWAQVRDNAERFEALNPYDRNIVPGSILKIEDDNFDRLTKKQRQLWCVTISAKRYALFVKDKLNRPSLLERGVNSKDNHWSEHGLGHLLNPVDFSNESRSWIPQFWDSIIRSSLGLPTKKFGFEKTPAIGRVTITNPGIIEPLAGLNEGKKYRDQIKPFNFLLTCHISPLGHPLGENPERFHLIAPFETNPKRWLHMHWIDQYSGKKCRITTATDYSSRNTARVQTYGDIFSEYAHHPEPKCVDERGNVCDRQTKGLLYRRHIRIGEIVAIGKESNKLEEVDAGLVHSADSVYITYPDPKRDAWERIVRPKLQAIPLSRLMAETGLSRRMLIKVRKGQVRPHPRNQELIANAVNRLLLEKEFPDSRWP